MSNEHNSQSSETTRVNSVKIKKKLLKDNIEIWSKAEKVLLGLIDPFEIEIESEIKKLSDIRKLTKDEDELHQGIKSYKFINEINSKQGEKLNQFLNKKININWENNNRSLQELLKTSSKFKTLKKNVQNAINEAKFAFPIMRKTEFPIALDKDFLMNNNNLLIDIYSRLERSELISKKGIINLDESYKTRLKPIEELEVDEEFYENISEALNTIQKEDEILILKYILSESYSESLMRLQALSYLASNGMVSLVPAEEDEVADSGRYKLINKPWVDSNLKENDIKNQGSTFILGISYSEWKELGSVIGQKSLKGRPILANLG